MEAGHKLDARDPLSPNRTAILLFVDARLEAKPRINLIKNTKQSDKGLLAGAN